MASVSKHVNRPTLVCLQCKQRKVRCNRQLPCSTCIRRGSENECTYGPGVDGVDGLGVFNAQAAGQHTPDSLDGQSTSTGSASAQSGVTPKQGRVKGYDYMGVNLYGSKEEVINFYDIQDHIYPDCKVSFHGPLAWSFIQRKDIALGFAFEYTSILETRKEIVSGISTQPIIETEQEFEDSSGDKREKQYNARKADVMNVHSLCEDNRPALRQRILSKLPKRRALRRFLDSFTTKVGPFMSYVDPATFTADIAKILGPLDAPYDDYPEFSFTGKDDLIYVGTLFIMLRLGFLALVAEGVNLNSPEQSHKPLSDECKELFSNSVDLSVIELAEECFKKFNLLVRPSIPLLQFAQMVRVYQKYAPEFGEGLDGGDSQLFTGVIIQMAISIGLHRDPDSIPALRHMPLSKKNLRRQLWYSLMFTDVVEAYSFGNPTNCQQQFYDTKVPKKIGKEGEGGVNTVYSHIYLLLSQLREVMLLALDVSGRTKVWELCQKLNGLEAFVAEEFGPLETFLVPTFDSKLMIERISSVKIALSFRIFFVGVYTHFFLHFTQVGNQELAFFYLRKLLSVELLYFLPNIFVIITRVQDLLGSSASLITTPNTLQVIHRTFLSLISLYVRLKFARYSWHRVLIEPNAEALEKIDAILRGLDTIFNVLLAALGKLVPRYYYAYKIVKSVKPCLSVIREDMFYASYYPGAVNLRNLPFDVENLGEILDIINLSLSKLHDNHKTQGDLLHLLKNGPPIQPCGLPLHPNEAGSMESSNGSDAFGNRAQTNAAVPKEANDPLDISNIDEFFARMLDNMQDIGENWSAADDVLSFEFFSGAGGR